jgi:ABC-type phosphate transport system substrate-binding protein
MKKRLALTMWVWLAFCPMIMILAGNIDVVIAAEKVVVIANKSLPDSSLSKNDLKQIALGDKTTVSGNEKVTFVTLEQGAVHEEFLKMIVEKSSFQFSNYWKQMIFTGKGKPPRSFKTEAELVSFVSTTKGAIGYVSAGADMSSVKVINIQ